MASSRKPAPKADPLEQQLLEAARSALATAVRLDAPAALPMQARAPRRHAADPLVIALSAGRDSMALLDVAHRLRESRAPHFRHLVAVHVDHGLQPAAAEFVGQCEAVCRDLQIDLEVRRVQVTARGRGIEAAARTERYAALAEVARRRHARCVLTAHHLDDRIETFLIQWLRGAGPDGLAAFPPARSFDHDLRLLRPFADITRGQIDAYVAQRRLAYVDDPSNDSPALLRNALRAHVMPALEAVRPGFARAAARSVDLVAEAAATLAEVGAADFAYCAEGAAAGTLRLDRLAQLTPPRRALAVRRWLAAEGLEAPSRARLLQVLDQSLAARSDARLLVRLGERELRRHRGLLMLRGPAPAPRADTAVRWRGEDAIHVASWGGVLRFVSAEGEGFAVDWLQQMPLELRARRGGERFKPQAGRPSRTLKRAFQDAGIAEFERADLPLVWRGDELIFVAGVGADVRLTDADGPRVRLQWQRDPRLLDD
jgi:tRNA(Ile)-lysidine synthase